MSGISDELRDFGTRLVHNASPFNCTFGDIRDYMNDIADRIDAETVELPRGKDGRPIHVDDTLYDSDGTQWTVVHIYYYSPDDGPDVVAQRGNAEINFEPPDYHGMTHERPDSLERIADELERYTNDSCSEDEIDGATASTLVDFSERIRALARKEAER